MTVVLRGDLPEEGRADQLNTIQEWIKANEGSVTKIDDWGRRRLAYEIGDQRDGFYSIITAELPAHAPAELERNMHISDNILRYLIIRDDE
jgi:small subunit ribosomal protein S6